MAYGLPNPACCPAATRTDATGAKPCCVFNKRRKSIWKRCWKRAGPFHPPSATNSCLLPEAWASSRPTTPVNWSGGFAKSAVNCCARRAVTDIFPIRFAGIVSSRLPGIRATCRAASSRTSSKTSVSRETNSILENSESCSTFDVDTNGHECHVKRGKRSGFRAESAEA